MHSYNLLLIKKKKKKEIIYKSAKDSYIDI